MPKLSDLVHDLSVVLRIEEKTVNTYARHLREAGMLSQGARGVHAPSATPLDAARLLIAMSVPGLAKDSPTTIGDFGKLVCWQAEESENRPDLRMGPFLNLPPRCTLEQAIAAVISAYGDDQKYEILAAGGDFLAHISVEIIAIMQAATLRVGWHEYYFHHPNTEHQLAAMDLVKSPTSASEHDWQEYEAANAEFQRLHNTYFRGLRQTVEIAGPELSLIGFMLAGHRDPGHVVSDEEYLAGLIAKYSSPSRSSGGEDASE